MTDTTHTRRQPEGRSYQARSVKGGTVIAEDVLDLETHRRLLGHPDNYRVYVSPCPRCSGSRTQTHCFRQRLLRPGDPAQPAMLVTVRLYRCASPSCRAVFTVLPAFIARHLWRFWETIDAVVKGTEPAPARTRRRWLSRLKSTAWELVQTFTSTIKGRVTGLLCREQPKTRLQFVEVVEQVAGTPCLALVAGWLQRLRPGLRLMQPAEVRVVDRDNGHPLPVSIRCGQTASLSDDRKPSDELLSPRRTGQFRTV